MRLSDLRTVRAADRTRIEVTVSWETVQRPSQTLFVETDSEFTDALTSDYDGFVVACALPALFLGERRIAMPGELCPRLADGLSFVMETFRQWRGIRNPPVALEPAGGFKSRYPATLPRTAMLLSGGVDSLAMLRTNRLYYPRDHPEAIQDGFLIEGFDLGGFGNQANARLDRMKQAVSTIAKDAGVTVIPVVTNLVDLNPDVHFYVRQWHGSVLAAVTHLFGKRITRTCIASTYNASTLASWGSHPLTDQYHSSSRLQIVHESAHLSRLEKTRYVADWDVGLQNLRVCFGNPENDLNCAGCEKCLRTMTALVALGKLRDCRAFPKRDVTPEMLADLAMSNNYTLLCYEELVSPLRERGRNDLADVIERKIKYYRPSIAFANMERGRWIGELTPLVREITSAIPLHSTLIVVDDGSEVGQTLNGYHTVPFLEQDGKYAGLPPDSATAIAELERLRRDGAQFVVFVYASFWWLDFYLDLQQHLRSQFRRVVESTRIIVFDLQSADRTISGN
jgi:hypothetical protein